ncbi:hypothetical protein HGRIS_014136 [Hohenbuehelia grisea]|uniref:Hydrophobin n=1 Tax=Hohenbuehelia grisea TaxID=104357 RepID=A0ABR3JUM9_9AGAR
MRIQTSNSIYCLNTLAGPPDVVRFIPSISSSDFHLVIPGPLKMFAKAALFVAALAISASASPMGSDLSRRSQCTTGQQACCITKVDHKNPHVKRALGPLNIDHLFGDLYLGCVLGGGWCVFRFV